MASPATADKVNRNGRALEANGETPTSAGRPQAQAVNTDLIPAVLKAVARWLVWRYVEEVDPATGEVDWDKPPVNAKTGGLASSTNAKTWSSFETACAAYQRGGLDGLGFVLHAQPGEDGGPVIVAIDLDKCRDPVTGAIDDWALQIIRNVNSYTEVSPSGRGIRIFLFGRLPPSGRKKGPFECYETGRYVTVTGQHVEGTPLSVEHRQAELERVHRHVFGDAGAPTRQAPGGGGVPANLEDAEVVRRAGAAKNGAKFRRLWHGDLTDYNSASEADLALVNYLAFWVGPNEARIDELFRQSGCFRTKWNRDDYRQRTIAKVLDGRTEYYDPSRRKGGRRSRTPTNGQRQDASADQEQPATPDEPAEAHLTDRGNAVRLVHRHGQDLRFCHPWGKWLVWDGGRWKLDDTGLVMRYAKETIASLYRWAAAQLASLADELEGNHAGG
jgi:primase-polymerase (primpol)-like protein